MNVFGELFMVRVKSFGVVILSILWTFSFSHTDSNAKEFVMRDVYKQYERDFEDMEFEITKFNGKDVLKVSNFYFEGVRNYNPSLIYDMKVDEFDGSLNFYLRISICKIKIFNKNFIKRDGIIFDDVNDQRFIHKKCMILPNSGLYEELCPIYAMGVGPNQFGDMLSNRNGLNEIDEIWKDIANYSGSNINHVSSINDNNCKKIFNSIDSKEEISQSVFIRCEKDIKNPIDVYIFSHLCEDKAVGHSLPIILLKDDLSVEDDYVGLLKKMIDFNVRHNCLV